MDSVNVFICNCVAKRTVLSISQSEETHPKKEAQGCIICFWLIPYGILVTALSARCS